MSTDPFPGLEPAIRTIRIFCDGGSRGNPGPAGIGAVVLDASREPAATPGVGERDDRHRHEQRRRVHGADPRARGRGTTMARAASRCGPTRSSLIRQLEGRYRVKNAGLAPLHRRAQELLRDVPRGRPATRATRGQRRGRRAGERGARRRRVTHRVLLVRRSVDRRRVRGVPQQRARLPADRARRARAAARGPARRPHGRRPLDRGRGRRARRS